VTAATAQEIRRRLESALRPLELDVLDEGYKHIGHANEGKGHYHVRIVSAEFIGILPIKRHRMVYAALSEMMDNSIHALSIDARDKK
jgi:BolA protein